MKITPRRKGVIALDIVLLILLAVGGGGWLVLAVAIGLIVWHFVFWKFFSN
jgi:hypothetical protein